ALAVPHVFISYSRTDSIFVHKLVQMLRERHFPATFDIDFQAGDNWRKNIEQSIVNSSAVIAVMSPDARDSTWVNKELDTAEAAGRPIVPILLTRDGQFPRLGHLQRTSVNADGTLPERFYAELERYVRRSNSALIVAMADALAQEKGFR